MSNLNEDRSGACCGLDYSPNRLGTVPLESLRDSLLESKRWPDFMIYMAVGTVGHFGALPAKVGFQHLVLLELIYIMSSAGNGARRCGVGII